MWVFRTEVVSGIKLSRYYGYLGVGLHDVAVSYTWTVHCLNCDLTLIESEGKARPIYFYGSLRLVGYILRLVVKGTSCDVSLMRLT